MKTKVRKTRGWSLLLLTLPLLAGDAFSRGVGAEKNSGGKPREIQTEVYVGSGQQRLQKMQALLFDGSTSVVGIAQRFTLGAVPLMVEYRYGSGITKGAGGVRSELETRHLRLSYVWHFHNPLGSGAPFLARQLVPSLHLGAGGVAYQMTVADQLVELKDGGRGWELSGGLQIEFPFVARPQFGIYFRHGYSYSQVRLQRFDFSENLLTRENTLGVSYEF